MITQLLRLFRPLPPVSRSTIENLIAAYPNGLHVATVSEDEINAIRKQLGSKEAIAKYAGYYRLTTAYYMEALKITL